MSSFFYGRDRELALLERLHQQGRTQLVVLYGKRRVGKTALCRRFLGDKPGLYYLADRTSAQDQLRLLSEQIANHFQDSFLLSRGFGTWLEVFAYLKDRARGLVLVIDEFPYLIEANPAISSVFQKGFDEHLADSGIFLLLTGSSIGMMETEVLGVRAPLYGRRTAQIQLGPLPFRIARRFFAAWTQDDAVRAFATLGGTPAYLLKFSDQRGYRDNVIAELLTPNSYLFEEPEFLLREKLREPRNYFAILRAVATGRQRLAELQNETGFDRSALSKYLHVLQSLHLVQREVPVTEHNPDKSKRGLYHIADPFLRFWFAFVFPARTFLLQEMMDWVWSQRIEPQLDRFVGPAFEELCRDHLRQQAGTHDPVVLEHLGRFWDRTTEIDVVAYDDALTQLLLGECKWSKNPVGRDVLRELQTKAAHVVHELGKTPQAIHYVLFSRSGFTDELSAISQEPDRVVRLIKLNDLSCDQGLTGRERK